MELLFCCFYGNLQSNVFFSHIDKCSFAMLSDRCDSPAHSYYVFAVVLLDREIYQLSVLADEAVDTDGWAKLRIIYIIESFTK